MQKRNVLNSPRLLELKKKKQKVFLNKIFLSILALFLVFAGFAYTSRISILNISLAEVRGNKAIDAEAVKTIIEKEITGNYLWFFPKTNILLYPKNKIKKELYNEFKRIKDINLSVKNKILEAALTEREAKYLWCGDTFPENGKDSQKCYFMDEGGYIFDEAPYFSGDVYFKFYGLIDQAGILPPGSFFYKENFMRLISFTDALVSMGLKPTALYIAEYGNAQIFLSGRDSLATDPKIIFKIDSDLLAAAKNLETALGAEPLQSNFKNKYSSLEYIDLRFGNKVYYRFR